MENEIYKTKDLAEAASLIVSKQQLIQIEREGKLCWFVFKNRKVCEKASNEYFFGNLQGNLRQYSEAMNVLKNRIFSFVR